MMSMLFLLTTQLDEHRQQRAAVRWLTASCFEGSFGALMTFPRCRRQSKDVVDSVRLQEMLHSFNQSMFYTLTCRCCRAMSRVMIGNQPDEN